MKDEEEKVARLKQFNNTDFRQSKIFRIILQWKYVISITGQLPSATPNIKKVAKGNFMQVQ